MYILTEVAAKIQRQDNWGTEYTTELGKLAVFHRGGKGSLVTDGDGMMSMRNHY